MEPIKTSLIIGDSYVEGTVTNIPTGLNRIIELNVYDAYGTIRYQGSATANVLADSVVSVLVTLVRKKGSIAVGGLISEIDTTTIPPTSTPWGPSELFKLGAQGSIFGSVLDLDEGRVWMSAEAKASQSGIDLVFMFYSGFFHLDNAIQAKYAGISNSINLTSSYDNAMIKDIGIVKVMGKPKDQESARKAFLNGTKIDGAPIEVGDMFLVESTGGKLAFVRAGSIVGADNRGSIEVDVSFVTLL